MAALARLIIAAAELFGGESRVPENRAVSPMMARVILCGCMLAGFAGAVLLLFGAYRTMATLWSPAVAASVEGAGLLIAAVITGCWALRQLRR
jgi:uncharacterized membrane protein